MKKALLFIATITIFFFVNIQEIKACHAIALVNFTQQNPIAGAIQVTAASNSPTCGCDEYWLDVEVRCLNEAFDGAPFSPGYHGPLNTYPYFQSAQMLKPSCVVQNYPWVTIPYTSLCPGMTYQYRMRENHNGQVGPWTGAMTFVVPGATQPLVAAANASQTTICAGACVNLTSSVAQGCQLAATYTWNNGLGTGQNKNNVCPPATTTYCVSITEACSGFTDQACVTVNVVPPPVNGNATVTPTTFCNTANPTLTLNGHSGTIQWQSAPNAGGPWTNIPGGTTTPFNPPQISTSTCYRAEITGCGVSGPTVLYSNVVCVNQVVPTPPTMSGTPESCAGLNDGTATATPVGMTAPISYSWNPSGQTTQTATGLAPGTYTVTVIDANGCTATNTFTVNPGTSVTANFTQPTNQCLVGNTFTFNNTGTTSPGTTYLWNFGDGNTSTQQNPTHTYAASGTYTVTLTTTLNGCTDTISYQVVVYDNPTLTAVDDSVSCFGANDASPSVIVNGGTAPYTYNWNPSGQTTNPATNLGPGAYTVTVTDVNSCPAQVTVNVYEPSQLTANGGQTHPTCNGYSDGTATANPSGGTPPYNYSWNSVPIQNTQTATNLPAGNYICTITDNNNCQVTVNVTLIDPPGMVLNPTFTPSNCGQPDGSASVTVVSGGTGPYTYSWSTVPVQNTQNATNIPAGTYTVTVVDQATGCSEDTTVTVTTTAGVIANTFLINDALCSGSLDGAAYATVTGGTAPFTYSWNTMPVTNNDTMFGGAGTYTVTITDANNCVGTATITINEPTPVVASIGGSNNPSCIGGANGDATANGSGGTPPYSYSWNTMPVQNTQTATGLSQGTYTVYVTDANGCLDSTTVTILDGQPLSSTIIPTMVSCNGGNDGAANLTMNGGTGPYNYNWTPSGFTGEDPNGLSAGTYYVSVTDQNNCPHNDTITITEPPVLIANIDSSFDATCNGYANGQAYASASGGTPPYNYSWNTAPVQNGASVTNLTAGVYVVTVTDANNCTATTTVTINEPTPIILTTGSINSYCNLTNGTAWVSVSGGVGPFGYEWLDGVNPIDFDDTLQNVLAGTYTISVIDSSHNCAASAQVTIGNNAAGTLTILSSNDVSCNGGNDGSATVGANNAFAPYSYSWNTVPIQTSPTANGLTAGNYTVTVTDSLGCVMNTNVTINEPNLLTVTSTPSNPVCPNNCDGYASTNVSGGTMPYFYQWNDPLLQTNDTATALCDGSYIIVVTDTNGCTATDTVTLNDPASIVLNTSATPASCNQSDGSVSVTVVSGAVAPINYSWNTIPVQNTQTATNIPAGTYTVTVTDANGCVMTDTATVGNLSGPSITVDSIYHVSCNGLSDGLIATTVTGGGFPYTYSWNTNPVQTTPTATNLPAGSYTLTATDTNGCVVSTAVTITEPSVLNLVSGGVDPICNGYSDGMVWVSPSGGTQPYNYSWNTVPINSNDTVNNLAFGSYTVTVTDSNGCFQTATVNLVNPPLLTVNVNGFDLSCFNSCDGSAMVTTNNGIAPFTYQWDDPANQTTDSIINLCSDTVRVVVTDVNGCFANGQVYINEPQLLVLSQNQVGNVSCNGGNDGFASVNVVGGTAPYSYNWQPGNLTGQNENNLAAGVYTVTVTDTNGCTDQITITITEPTPLAAAASTIDVDCFGANTGKAWVTVNGGTPPYSYQWNDGMLQQTDTAFNLVAGTYDVTITDSLGCTFTINGITINEPTQIVLNTSTVSSTCGQPNGSASVVAGGGTGPYSYAWNTVPIQNSSTANNISAGNYTVIVTDANGCTASAPANVTDVGGPSVDSVTTTPVSCSGAGDGSATAFVTGGTAPYTYSWGTVPVQTGITANNLNGGIISVTVTDVNGCIASGNGNVIENSGISVAIINPVNVSCNGLSDGSAELFAVGGNPGGYTYSWNTAPAQNTQIATGLPAGTYIGTAYDVNGCSASDTITITEPLPLSITLDSLKNVNCFGGNDGYINIIASGGTPAYSYTWTPNVSSGATATSLSMGSYDVTVTDNNGCTATTQYNISEPTQLTVGTTTVSSTCGQANGSATANPSGGVTPYTYLWNASPNQNTQTATNLLAGNYTVVVTDGNGCTANANAGVVDLVGPVIDSIVTTPVSCFGGSDGTATVYVEGNPPYTYSWNDPFGQTTQTATGLSASPPIYTVVVTDVNGCTSSGIAVITEPSQLFALITGPDTVCYGEEVQLFGVGVGGTSPYNFNWPTLGGLTGQGPVLDTMYNTTTYTLNILDGSNAGCTASTTKTIHVRAPLNVNSNDVTICEGENATLNATSTGGINNHNYYWQIFDGTNYLPTGIPNPTNPLVVSPSDTTQYLLYVEDACSINDSMYVMVNVNDTATGTIVTVNDKGCPSHTADFSIVTDLGTDFHWDFDSDGTIDLVSTSTTVNYTYQYPGNYDVTLYIYTNEGCVSTIYEPNWIEVYPEPIADFTFDPQVTTLLNPTINFTDQSIGANSWNWSFGDGDNSTIQNPSHTYQDTGFYNVVLTVANTYGCYDTTSKMIEIEPDFVLLVPNSFTPDGDGLNDNFFPVGVGINEREYSFFIFNRWGELIFEAYNSDEGWDGTAKGKSEISPTGVYVWVIETKDLNGENHKYIGNVNLLK